MRKVWNRLILSANYFSNTNIVNGYKIESTKNTVFIVLNYYVLYVSVPFKGNRLSVRHLFRPLKRPDRCLVPLPKQLLRARLDFRSTFGSPPRTVGVLSKPGLSTISDYRFDKNSCGARPPVYRTPKRVLLGDNCRFAFSSRKYLP